MVIIFAATAAEVQVDWEKPDLSALVVVLSQTSKEILLISARDALRE